MKRKTLLEGAGWSAALLLFAPRYARAAAPNWSELRRQVGPRLLQLRSPFDACRSDGNGEACAILWKNVRNPYYIGEHPELTQTLGWAGAWNTATSPFAVAA